MKSFISHSEEETLDIATKFAKTLTVGKIVSLHGNLGAGKTVFAHGFAKSLGITEHITSPTFTIIQEYKILTDDSLQQWLFHMDLYRIADSSAALAFGIDEYLDDENAFKLIEWSERISDLLPYDIVNVTIKHIDESSREIIIEE